MSGTRNVSECTDSCNGLNCDNIPEMIDPVDCQVSGDIPKWLNGTLLRNGPGMFQIGPDTYGHLFDGMALLQRFRIFQGRVQFSSRYLRSEAFKRNEKAQRIVVSEFGTMARLDPCKALFARYLSYYFPCEMSDNAMINFIRLKDQLYAANEFPVLTEVDSRSLDTIARVNLKRYISINSATAHPHYDRRGNLYNIGTGNGCYKVVRTDTSLQRSRSFDHVEQQNPFEGMHVIGSIALNEPLKPCYYHSFAMTDNFLVFLEMPLRIHLCRLLTTRFRRGSKFSNALQWHPEQTVRVHIMRLSDGRLIETVYWMRAFFTFHHVNAYEQDNCIIMDYCAYDSAELITQLSLHDLTRAKLPDQKAFLKRVVIPLKISKVTSDVGKDLLSGKRVAGRCEAILNANKSVKLVPENIVDISFELPRINYEFSNGRPYSYCYGITTSDQRMMNKGSLAKINVNSKNYDLWSPTEAGHFAAEPVFVADPAALAEDDGLVIAPVLNLNQNGDYYIILISGMTFDLLATVHLPSPLTFGFHSIFISDHINE